MKLFILISIIGNIFTQLVKQEDSFASVHTITADSTLQYQLQAYTLLQTKCNVCHEQRNRHAVFTFNNMNTWGTQINEQVFIKKRMPKGNVIVLTSADKEILKKWLTTSKY